MVVGGSERREEEMGISTPAPCTPFTVGGFTPRGRGGGGTPMRDAVKLLYHLIELYD